MNKKISVIIPTYKPKSYLWECLDSLYNQTLPKNDYEVILVLNGCNEPYNTAICEYISQHKEICFNYLKFERGGVSYARNCGIDLASGDYITFIDDDDYVSACYLEEMLSAVSPNEVAICDSLSFEDGSKDFDESYIIHQSYIRLKNRKGLYNVNNVRKYLQGPCRSLIYRDIIGERRFNEKFRNGEDSLFMFLISNRFSSFNLTKDTAVYYRRIRKGSASNSQGKREKWTNAMRLIQAYISIYIKQPKNYNLQFFLTRVLGALHSIYDQ